MAVSLRQANDGPVGISILVDGAKVEDEISITRIETNSAVNGIPWAEVEIDVPRLSDVQNRSDLAPGKAMQIEAGYSDRLKRLFEGIIVKQRLFTTPDGELQLAISCADEAIKTSLTRVNAVFQHEADSRIIESLLHDAGLGADVAPTAVSHAQTVLADESVWDFVLRRAAVNGMVVTLDGGTVSVRPPSSAPAEFMAQYGDTIISLDLQLDASTQVASVTASAWSPSSQSNETVVAREPTVPAQGDLMGEKLAKAVGSPVVRLQSQAQLGTAELQAWADARLLASRLARIRGTVTVAGTAAVRPDQCLELAGLGNRFDGTGYLSAVRHRLANGTWTSELTFGLPAPSRAEPTSRVSDLQVASVLEADEDSDAADKVRVALPLGDGDGIWARWAGPGSPPAAGERVVVGVLDGDQGAPIVLGTLHAT